MMLMNWPIFLRRQAEKLGLNLAADGAMEIASRARGTPRVAGRLLRRVRDIAAVEGADTVTAAVADAALVRLEVDAQGLDAMDRRYLSCMADSYSGGPVGVETLAAVLSEQRDVLGRSDRTVFDANWAVNAHPARPLSVCGWLGLSRCDAASQQRYDSSICSRRLTTKMGQTNPTKTKVMCDRVIAKKTN